MKPLPKIQCPTCRKEGDWFAGPYGPFCSRRCKLLDLGKWFNQEHCVSEPLRPEQLEQYADSTTVPDPDGGDGDEKN